MTDISGVRKAIRDRAANLSDVDRPTEQCLLVQLANGLLRVLGPLKLDDAVKEQYEQVMCEPWYHVRIERDMTDPQPFDWPLGSISTSAKTTFPANST